MRRRTDQPAAAREDAQDAGDCKRQIAAGALGVRDDSRGGGDVGSGIGGLLVTSECVGPNKGAADPANKPTAGDDVDGQPGTPKGLSEAATASGVTPTSWSTST
ncbi:MAG: hypothetical protein R2724_04405 [Bryobacterales bacterium]